MYGHCPSLLWCVEFAYSICSSLTLIHLRFLDNNTNGVYEPGLGEIPFGGMTLDMWYTDNVNGDPDTKSNYTLYGSNVTQADGYYYLESTTWAPLTEFVFINPDNVTDPLGVSAFEVG